MKKNNMLRLASVLLVAVLLSTCALSSAFAKYYRDNAANDKAQVAKWGVLIETGAMDPDDVSTGLFDTKYASNDSKYTSDTVIASGDWKLVAPGTSDTWNAFDVSGEPEVAVRLTYTADVTLANWSTNLQDAANTEYLPVVFTVGTQEIKLDTNNEKLDTVAEVEKAIEDALTAASKDYAPKTDLNTVDFPTISWVWDFGKDEKVKDTALGDNAAAGHAAEIIIAVTATIEQID